MRMSIPVSSLVEILIFPDVPNSPYAPLTQLLFYGHLGASGFYLA